MNTKPSRIRCAIYTRKSSEEGLEQEFNSLDAQREACEAYILSQKQEGWVALKEIYDDGGFSGGTLERPAIQRLMEQIRGSHIDLVVVYKVDRLTRSLADFAKIVETFDAHKVSFVSVTQQFNTSTSMGRLTLNVLLSFAQFEREITGERIRDKLAASARKGLWTGGIVPIGYDVVDKKLIVNRAEAETVRTIYRKYLALKNVRELRAWLAQQGYRSKVRISRKGIRSGGYPFAKGALYRILQNAVYIGQKEHLKRVYPAEHEPIIDRALWKQVQDVIAANRILHRDNPRAKAPSLLAGLISDDRGNRMLPVHANKSGKRYRYYVSSAVHKGESGKVGAIRRIPAADIEQIAIGQLLKHLKDPQSLIHQPEGLAPDGRRKALILTAANRTLKAWPAMSPNDQRVLVRQVIRAIQVTEREVRVTCDVRGLTRALGLETGTSPNEEVADTIPARITRIGGQTRTIIEGRLQEPPANRKEPRLIDALSMSYAWKRAFLANPTITLRQVALQTQYTERYATRIARLAYLAPDITQSILDGTQPRSLTLKKLLADVPDSWTEQRRRFGYA